MPAHIASSKKKTTHVVFFYIFAVTFIPATDTSHFAYSTYYQPLKPKYKKNYPSSTYYVVGLNRYVQYVNYTTGDICNNP